MPDELKTYVTWPTRRPQWPIGGTVILWLLLDRTHPAGWVVGMAWTVCVIVWVGVAFEVFRPGRNVRVKPEALTDA